MSVVQVLLDKTERIMLDLEELDIEWVSVPNEDEQVLGDENCDICGLTFNSRMLLQNHNEEYPLCCRKCGVCYATF